MAEANEQPVPTINIVEQCIENKRNRDGSVLLDTIRSCLNILTQYFIAITVFICLWYSCRSEKVNKFELHIVLCVLGYQFFMCQGILSLSRHNAWSAHIKRRYRRHLHWALQVVGIVFAAAGSIEIMRVKTKNFETAHGIFGLLALITGFICVLNGIITTSAKRLSSYMNVYIIKLVHYITGVVTLILAAISLSFGYDNVSFRTWTGNDALIQFLMTINWFVTIFVALDFWINTGIRIKSLIKK